MLSFHSRRMSHTSLKRDFLWTCDFPNKNLQMVQWTFDVLSVSDERKKARRGQYYFCSLGPHLFWECLSFSINIRRFLVSVNLQRYLHLKASSRQNSYNKHFKTLNDSHKILVFISSKSILLNCS